MNMFRLGIRGRIYSGFGVLVVLSLALAAFAGGQLAKIDNEVGKLAAIADNTTRALQVTHDLETMRRSTLAFLTYGEDAQLKDGDEAAPNAVKLLQEAAQATLSEEARRICNNVGTEISAYEGMRHTLVGLVRKSKADKDALFRIGDNITATTEALVGAARATNDPQVAEAVTAAAADILLVREANWRFQATRDPKGPETFKTKADKASAALAALEDKSLPDDVWVLIAPVNSALSAYSTSFMDIAADTLKTDDLFNKEMVPHITRMQEEMASAQASLNRDLETTKKEGQETGVSTLKLQKLIGALALLLGGVIAYGVGRGIVRPVSGMTAAMKRLAAGDTGAEIPSRDRHDEIGAMAQAVQVFKQNAVERAQLEAEAKEAAARTAAQRKTELHDLAQRFEGAVGSIIDSISSSAIELETAAGTLTRTADSTQQLSGVVAAASEQASANVQSVASSTDEMASSVSEISRQVQESSSIARTAVSQAQTTDARIGELCQVANRIGDVVKLITAIAEQTNLLALNATIEAARAGQAGRGFAVVAQEVKALAAQTAKATEEIDNQITAMQTATKDSVSAIKEIGATIDRVAEIASTIAAAVEEQGAATQEIARSVHQAAQGTSQVAVNIADVNRGAGETGSASGQVLSSARTLAGEGARLKLEVDRFLATVRAA